MNRQEPGNNKERSNAKQRVNPSNSKAKPAAQEAPAPQSSELATPRDRAHNIRNLLQELGLSKKGLSKLSEDSVTKLASLLQTPGQRSNLITSMFNVVTETTPKKIGRFVETIHSYRGSFPILREFLTQLGQKNPFLAAERAQIMVLPDRQNNVRGASGHILSGVTYMAYDPQVPTTTTGYFSGKQAIVQIFKAWHPERLGEESKRSVRDRRHNQLRSALLEIDLENLTLGDFDANPALTGEVGSRIIARNLDVYNELRKAIDQCKTHLSSMIYGGDIVLPGINSLKVNQDPGRQFFGWFEEHFKENENAPIGIEIAYQSIIDEDIALTPEEEAHYVRGLLAYQRVHSFINKATALGGLLSDLHQYDALSINDELRLNPAIEKARIRLQETVQSTPTELSIAEFATMLENASMVQFRQAMNKRILDAHRDEFEAALKLFDFVSFENGAWREDALSDSVPMERLKRHLYGAKVGVEKSWYGPDKKRAALGQSDFRHIMDAQFLRRVVTTEEKLLNAQPIEQFRAMVEGVVVAYRKATFLEARLAEHGITPNGMEATRTLQKENVGDTLKGWKPVLPIGGTYKLTERWFEETGDPKPGLQSLSEIVARICDRKSYFFPRDSKSKNEFRDKYNGLIAEIEQFAGAGLYRPDMDEMWRTLAEKVAEFIPTADHRELMDRAIQLFVHPMVVSSYYLNRETLSRKFLAPHEFNLVRSFVEVEAGLREVCNGYNTAELGELRTRAEERLRAQILRGGVRVLPDGQRQLTLEQISFANLAGIIRPNHANSFETAEYFDPKLLAAALDSIDHSYISVSTLSADWINRAKTLCSKDGGHVLGKAGYALVDTPTFKVARDITPRGDYYVSKDFVNEVNRLLPGFGD